MHAGTKFLFKVVGTGTVVTKLVTKSITTGASTLLVEYLCTKDYKTIVFLYTCRTFIVNWPGFPFVSTWPNC